MAKLSKIYHSLNLINKRIFVCFVLLYTNFDFSFSQNIGNKIQTIVIDPGHGGKDPGNLGTGRYKENEKEIVLDVALRLGKYIKDSFPEINVLYTREDDSYPTLRERTDFANDNSADLFISIHCDAFTKSSANGSSSHVMGLDYSEKNLRVVQKENSVIYLEDNYKENYDGFDPSTPESYIVFSLTQNSYLDQSILFAQNVQDQFRDKVNRVDRGVRQSPFWVISRTNMPSVLIELGFLTNPDEEDYLHSEQGKKVLSFAIFSAFCSYKANIDGSVSASKEENKRNEQNKDLAKEISELDVIYKIQLGTYLESMLNSVVFIDIQIEEVIINGVYKYLTSPTNNKKEADKIKIKYRLGNFPDAFIVAFYKGEQISVKEALDLQNKLKL